MADGKRLFPAPRVIALAALAGVVAGAVAVYVTGGPSGNNLSPEAVACAAKSGRAKDVAAAAAGQVAAMLPADPPVPLTDLAFNGPDGQAMTLADLGGKTLLVNLCATWCAPCRAEMPALDTLELERGGESFEVVAINVDTGDDEKPRKFLSEIGVESLGYYRDASMKVFNDLKAKSLALGLPVTLLVDAEGCLLANMNGPAEWAGEDAGRLIDKALAE